MAPSGNALPQHNPYLVEIKNSERDRGQVNTFGDDQININLTYPKNSND